MSARVAALAHESRLTVIGEHRRLLYVAMTRAAERLIVCGCEGARGVPNGSWYAFVQTGLGRRLATEAAPWSDKETIQVMGEAQRAANAVERPATETLVLPEWLTRPPVSEAKPKTRRASVAAFAGPDRARAEGRYFHFLLETLATAAHGARTRAAEAVSPRSFGVSEADAAGLRTAALAILASAELAPFFSAESRGEVAIGSLGAAPIDFRIDRLALVGDEVWIADFKLGAPPAHAPADYAEQLAAYRDAVGQLFPTRKVRTFLIWSSDAKAAELTFHITEAGNAEKTGLPNALKGSHFLDTV